MSVRVCVFVHSVTRVKFRIFVFSYGTVRVACGGFSVFPRVFRRKTRVG